MCYLIVVTSATVGRALPKLSKSTVVFWQGVAQCETGGIFGHPLWDWGKYRNRTPLEGSLYEGGVGFAATTWAVWAQELHLYRRYPHAFLAPILVQIYVADYGLRFHRGYWGCLHH